MHTLNYLHLSQKRTLNKRFIHQSPVHAIYPDQITDIEPVNPESLDKQGIKDKIFETRQVSKEVRKDLRITVDNLNRITKRRVFDFRKQDPMADAQLTEQEEKVKSCFVEAKATGLSGNPGLDTLNEYSMRDAMLAVHKSELTASMMNIKRSGEELETANAAKGLVSDIGQLRENHFSLTQGRNAELDNNSQSNANQNNSHHTSSNKNEGSLIDDYSNFAEHMPDYGVGGGED